MPRVDLNGPSEVVIDDAAGRGVHTVEAGDGSETQFERHHLGEVVS